MLVGGETKRTLVGGIYLLDTVIFLIWPFLLLVMLCFYSPFSEIYKRCLPFLNISAVQLRIFFKYFHYTDVTV